VPEVTREASLLSTSEAWKEETSEAWKEETSEAWKEETSEAWKEETSEAWKEETSEASFFFASALFTRAKRRRLFRQRENLGLALLRGRDDVKEEDNVISSLLSASRAKRHSHSGHRLRLLCFRFAIQGEDDEWEGSGLLLIGHPRRPGCLS
jgi:hypothetical protein